MNTLKHLRLECGSRGGRWARRALQDLVVMTCARGQYLADSLARLREKLFTPLVDKFTVVSPRSRSWTLPCEALRIPVSRGTFSTHAHTCCLEPCSVRPAHHGSPACPACGCWKQEGFPKVSARDRWRVQARQAVGAAMGASSALAAGAATAK